MCRPTGTLRRSRRYGHDLEYGTLYKWSDYVHNVSSIILARHADADRIICVIDPYNAAYSTKGDE